MTQDPNSNTHDLNIILTELRKRFSQVPIHRVLLVNPPSSPGDGFDPAAARKKRYSAYPPYGPLLIAAHLRRRHYDVRVLDLNLELLASIFHMPSIDAFEYSIAWQRPLFDMLDDFRPDIVGVTCMFTMTHKVFVQVVQAIKNHLPVPVVIGGVHVTNDTERTLRDIGVADAAFTHEADLALPKLLDFINGDGSVQSTDLCQLALIIDDAYHKIDQRHTPTSEDLSVIPAFDLVDTAHYSQYGSIGMAVSLLPKDCRISTVLTNRGCRAQCTFCSVRFFNGPTVRARTVQSVADEIELLYSTYAVPHISWLDDDLFYSEARTIALFNEIVRRNLKITWDAGNGVIAAAATPDVIAAAFESGCIGLYFGIESGNPQLLREMRKPGTVEKFRQAAQLLKDYPSICTRGFLMIGFPNETLRMMMDTLTFALELDLDWYNISVLQPLPSTPIYTKMQEQGLLEAQPFTDEVKYFTGPYGKQSQRERFQKKVAKNFREEFSRLNMAEVPQRDQLPNIWFYMNYKINFEHILSIDNPVKREIQLRYLRDIADRVTSDHAFAHFYTAVLEEKSDNYEEALRRIGVTERAVNESAYWRDKFTAFDVYSELDDLKKKLNEKLTRRERESVDVLQ